MAALKVFLIYPSAAITALLSPTDPCGSEGWASSSSDEPALDDSSSLSARIHCFGLELKNTPVVNFQYKLLTMEESSRGMCNCKLQPASPHLLVLQNTMSLVLSIFAQLAQVHLCFLCDTLEETVALPVDKTT